MGFLSMVMFNIQYPLANDQLPKSSVQYPVSSISTPITHICIILLCDFCCKLKQVYLVSFNCITYGCKLTTINRVVYDSGI